MSQRDMYACLVARCNSNPMTASGAHPPEVPTVARNTQADDTLPSIITGRGGANCWITPGPHTQLFGGARPPPPLEKPSPAALREPPLPPPPKGPPADS